MSITRENLFKEHILKTIPSLFAQLQKDDKKEDDKNNIVAAFIHEIVTYLISLKSEGYKVYAETLLKKDENNKSPLDYLFSPNNKLDYKQWLDIVTPIIQFKYESNNDDIRHDKFDRFIDSKLKTVESRKNINEICPYVIPFVLKKIEIPQQIRQEYYTDIKTLLEGVYHDDDAQNNIYLTIANSPANIEKTLSLLFKLTNPDAETAKEFEITPQKKAEFRQICFNGMKVRNADSDNILTKLLKRRADKNDKTSKDDIDKSIMKICDFLSYLNPKKINGCDVIKEEIAAFLGCDKQEDVIDLVNRIEDPKFPPVKAKLLDVINNKLNGTQHKDALLQKDDLLTERKLKISASLSLSSGIAGLKTSFTNFRLSKSTTSSNNVDIELLLSKILTNLEKRHDQKKFEDFVNCLVARLYGKPVEPVSVSKFSLGSNSANLRNQISLLSPQQAEKLIDELKKGDNSQNKIASALSQSIENVKMKCNLSISGSSVLFSEETGLDILNKIFIYLENLHASNSDGYNKKIDFFVNRLGEILYPGIEVFLSFKSSGEIANDKVFAQLYKDKDKVKQAIDCFIGALKNEKTKNATAKQIIDKYEQLERGDEFTAYQNSRKTYTNASVGKK